MSSTPGRLARRGRGVRASPLGQAKSAQLRVFGVGAGPQIGHATALVGDVAQRPVEAGPALGLHLPLQGGADLLLAARAELQGDAFRGAVAKTSADVVAADDQVLAVIGPAADQNMDMRVVGVPMIDRDPIERCRDRVPMSAPARA